MSKNKNLLILLGASGSGKSTLEKKLYENNKNIFDRVVSATTRPKRNGEIDGVDYFFVDNNKFSNIPMAESDGIDGSFYGTPASELTKGDKHLILTMEPNGARKIVEYIKDNGLNIKPVVVYFKISEEIRINNMKKRGDELNKILKRVKNDDIDQRFINSNLVADIEINSLEKDYTEEILELIK